jgi:hypothetical protein
MVSKRSERSTKPSVDSLKKASLAIEDLLFAIQRIRPDQLRDVISSIDYLLNDSNLQVNSSVAKTYQSPDPNKRFLIGALPRLLLDRELFPSNEDIADFAEAALCLDMTRSKKVSRHDIIGKIVCETDTLDEQQLTDLVRALELIVGNKERLASMIEKKKSGTFSWNETLQELLRSR